MNGIEKMAFTLYAMDQSGLLPTRTAQIQGIVRAVVRYIEEHPYEEDINLDLNCGILLTEEEQEYIRKEVEKCFQQH